MTQEDLAVLAGFGAVWERVSGQRLEAPPAPSVAWEDVLDGLYEYWKDCGSLAARAVGGCRMRLLCLAAEAKEAFRRLQTEYFLETGDVFVAAVVCNFASYTPYNLRKLCKNAVKLAGLLQKGSEEGCLPVADAGKCLARHEEIIKALLTECLQ